MTENIKPFNALVADLTDEDLEMIIELRKKINPTLEREGYVKGLYYISTIDNDYSDVERDLVIGTACALGIGEKRLNEIIGYVTGANNPIKTFAKSGDKKYREQLFEEMGALTYLKGYQLNIEDEALKAVAAEMDIPDKNVEDTLTELYLKAQGIEIEKISTEKILIGAGGVIAGAAICGLTAGLAVPALGAAIGTGIGISGTAVATAGAVVGGSGSALALSIKENIDNAADMKKLKTVIKKQQKDEMTKAEITNNLVKGIDILKQRLKVLEEKEASKRDKAIVELQLRNMQAQKAELELASGE